MSWRWLIEDILSVDNDLSLVIVDTNGSQGTVCLEHAEIDDGQMVLPLDVIRFSDIERIEIPSYFAFAPNKLNGNEEVRSLLSELDSPFKLIEVVKESGPFLGRTIVIQISGP